MDLVRWVRNQWDRVLAWLLAGVGALALILGWVGVTDTPYSWEQIPFVISGGLGGIYLLGLGAMFWFSADLRDEWRKIDALTEIEERLVDLLQQAESRAAGETVTPPPVANGRNGQEKVVSAAAPSRSTDSAA